MNHVLKVSRVAYTLADQLKNRRAPGYEDIDLRYVVEAAVLHDITKLYGEDREKLPLPIKRQMGLAENFREISPEVDEVGIAWLKKLGFPSAVYEAIHGHDFPERVVDDPYWKIVLVADYMVGQRVKSTKERLADVEERWITHQKLDEIFGELGLSDREFIERHRLNNDRATKRWEEFLRETTEKREEGRAKELVRLFIG